MNKQSNKILSRLKAFANPIRFDILEYLMHEEQCVCNIFDQLKLPQNLVSHHLAILRETNLIKAKKDGKWVYYSLNSACFKNLAEFIKQFSKSKHTKNIHKC